MASKNSAFVAAHDNNIFHFAVAALKKDSISEISPMRCLFWSLPMIGMHGVTAADSESNDSQITLFLEITLKK